MRFPDLEDGKTKTQNISHKTENSSGRGVVPGNRLANAKESVLALPVEDINLFERIGYSWH